MYFVTNDIKEYFKTHGNVSLSEEELSKCVEIFYVFYSVISRKNDIFSSDEVQEKRTATCIKCPEYDSKHLTCNLCGCYIPNKIKAPYESCPADKWIMDLQVLRKLIEDSVDYINEQLNRNMLTIEEHQAINN